MIQLLSATPHNHSKQQLEKWFGDEVDIIPLSNRRRRPLTREYIHSVTADINEGVKRIHAGSRIFFLVTGHPFFNVVAYECLHKMRYPFLLLVYIPDRNTYEAFSSDMVLQWSQVARE